MMIYKLSPNLLTDESFYFFSMLSDRFEPVNEIWAQQLEKKFNEKFKPIYVLPFKHNKLFEEENYIVLNEKLEKLQKKLKREDVIDLIYPEDLNRQFCESPLVQELIDKLINKQGKLFVLSFSSVWLDLKNPKITILGPTSHVATKFDDKIEHVKIFRELDLPIKETKKYDNFDKLKKADKEYPFFLSPSFSSGGIESKAVFTDTDLDIFYSSLRPVNKIGAFIATQLMEHVSFAPNASAIVLDKNKTEIICITDQILRNNKYMGNFYPSMISEKHKELIVEMTRKMGDYLSSQDFRGLFGLDFLISPEGDCYVTDLNPRRQGGYLCNVLMSKKINIIDLELKLALGENVPEVKFEDFQVDYCWAHSKLTPYFDNMEIKKEFRIGSPFGPFEKIGTTYKTIFYPKRHVIVKGNPGFYLTTDYSYSKMKKRLFRETERTISQSYALYEGS